MSLRSLLTRLDSLAALLQSPLLLVIRLYWGGAFVQAGWGKFGRIDEVAAWFGDTLHLPFPRLNALLAAGTELGGGVLLALGLGSRVVAVPLAGTMGVAFATAHREELAAVFRDPATFVAAPPFTFLAAALVVLAFGPGRLSLDHLWARRSAAVAQAPGGRQRSS